MKRQNSGGPCDGGMSGTDNKRPRDDSYNDALVEEKFELRLLIQKEKEEAKKKAEELKKEKEEAKKKAEELKKEKEELRLRQKREKEEQQKLLAEAKAQKKKEMEELKKKRDEEAQQKKEEYEKKKEEWERKRKVEEEKKELKRREEEAKEAEVRRQSDLLLKFFKKPEKQELTRSSPTFFESALFKRFEVKDGMILATIHVRPPLSNEEYDKLITIQVDQSDYITRCVTEKSKKKLIKKKGAYKMKYYHFHDNYRPPYYGTWRKKSKFISGRRPFDTKEVNINYEYDSDEDWQNEPSDAEDVNSEDDMEPEDEEIDSEEDGFFVPHGYISEDEGSNDEEIGREDPEMRKKRLEELDAEFKESMQIKARRVKKKLLNPRLIGPYFGEIDTMVITEEDIEKHFIPGVLFNYPSEEIVN